MADELKELRIARLDLVNARVAVESLPTIQARAEKAVADAKGRLARAQAALDHVLDAEIPATRDRVAELESFVADLEQQER